MDPKRRHHLDLAALNDFTFECDPRLFSDEQYALIRRYGHWYEALSNGKLPPITEAQKRFVEAVLGPAHPEDAHAAAWWRYRKRREIEEKYGEAMHRSHQEDADTFYNREMAKQLRKTMGGVNLREHKRG